MDSGFQIFKGIKKLVITLCYVALCGMVFILGCSRDKDGNGDAGESDSDERSTESASMLDSDSVSDTESETFAKVGTLAFNEVMSKNDGVVLDEALEAEDWIELICTGDEAINLSDYQIAKDGGTPNALPDYKLSPGETVILFADREPTQGQRHLNIKISADGEQLTLLNANEEILDTLDVPPLAPNVSYARIPDGDGDFVTCRYATPDTPNGSECIPPAPKGLEEESFEEYQWPDDALAPEGPLVINELLLKPAAFIEIANIGSEAVSLEDYSLTISPHFPGVQWPQAGEGTVISLGMGALQRGEYLSVALDSAHTEALAADTLFEGVVTLFYASEVADRVDFMSWPDGSALAREPDGTGLFTYCLNTTPDAPNNCEQTATREVGDRLRYLRTPTDFDKLAEGGAKLGIGSVKFVVDMDAGNAVHLLGAWDWDLHYTFVREVIDGDPPLDRCDASENAQFNQGWGTFSSENYYTVEGRRYLLGTLSHHSSADLRCVEYTFGDEISAQQMKFGYYQAIARTNTPTQWVLRPQDDIQVAKARSIEGQLPIVGPTAPFANVVYQTLTEGVGYGTLRYIPATDLSAAALGPKTIVVTDDVPNDIPYVGGLITEAFQTPLSHVNILSKSRNTPNIAVKNARTDERIAPFIDELVKLEVFPTHFEISMANPAEAQTHWESLVPDGPMLTPLLDDSVRGIVSLGKDVGFEHRGSIGAKAAQLSELTRIASGFSRCDTVFPLPTPKAAFAIPVAHYLDHFESSGAKAVFDDAKQNADFQSDPAVRAVELARMRELILSHPVDDALMAEVAGEVADRFGNERVRFRSSSNTEDLQEFNGAGLYTSQSGQLNDPERSIDDAIRVVWASLWNDRAFDERQYARIDHNGVAMGILVHEAFLSEEANGVAVSRDITDVTRGDRYYVNAQAGEGSVANPAPGVTTEQAIYQWPSRLPTLRMMAQSSLVPDAVLWNSNTPDSSEIYLQGEVLGETRDVVRALRAIHNHFEALLDPNDEEPLFAMEIEFKLEHATRKLLIKQTRPYSFGALPFPADCREL
ncbi:MAG: lamin tail domain-containing protein [Deltaproteobacteria bacterium]|nr:lamin tail domain-containing protein [Deltaproteobacteria bacterium]